MLKFIISHLISMARLLTQHNTMSFENFITRDIPRIISDSRNVIRVLKNKENNEYKTKVYFYLGGEDGKQIEYKAPKLIPNDCRLDGLTYQGILEITVFSKNVWKQISS